MTLNIVDLKRKIAFATQHYQEWRRLSEIILQKKVYRIHNIFTIKMKQNNRKIWKLRREVKSIHFTDSIEQTNGAVSNDNEHKRYALHLF